MEQESRTGIEIKVGFFPLGWFLFFFHPIIEVDGVRHEETWGRHFFELEPGRHALRIFIEKNARVPWWLPFRGYLGDTSDMAGESSTEVTVEEGEAVTLKYYMPPWMYAHPAIRVFKK